MIQRKTQNPAYWGEEFTITPDDLQYLSTVLVEDELPRSAEDLGRALILDRCRQEEALIERAMSRGTPYQPKRSYKVGEQVVFPALSFRAAKVVGVRPGHNPEYGSFQVQAVAPEMIDQQMLAAAIVLPVVGPADVAAFSPDLLRLLQTTVNEISGFTVFNGVTSPGA